MCDYCGTVNTRDSHLCVTCERNITPLQHCTRTKKVRREAVGSCRHGRWQKPLTLPTTATPNLLLCIPLSAFVIVCHHLSLFVIICHCLPSFVCLSLSCVIVLVSCHPSLCLLQVYPLMFCGAEESCVMCSACGRVNARDARFCDWCGVQVSECAVCGSRH